jgi:hypothetical protein
MPRRVSAFPAILILAVGAFAFAPGARAAPCGGLNQPVCKKFPNPLNAQCGQWLRNVSGYCRPCGGRNQQACAVLAKGPVCRPGLERRGGTCVAARADLKDRMLADARQRARRLKPLIDGMAAFARGFDRGKTARLRAAVKARNAGTVRTEVIGDPRAFAMKRLMLRFGFNTMTVGIESSASFVAGAMRETGASMDLHEQAGPKLYVTNAVLGGVIANVGNDIAISAWTARNGAIDGPAWGAMGSFDVLTGIGITIWYAKQTLQPIGVSVNIGIGNVGAGGAVVHATTWLCPPVCNK